MVAAVHFFATDGDERTLLSYLAKSGTLSFVPFAPVPVAAPVLREWEEAGALGKLGVLSDAFGAVVLTRPGDDSFTEGTRSGLFNRVNWDRWGPVDNESIVDWNSSPALFWDRGTFDPPVLSPSAIGSQANSMASISSDYERWVQRVQGWIRRRGAKVWDWKPSSPGSAWDIDLPFVNAVYALPGAMEHFEQGGLGRATAAAAT